MGIGEANHAETQRSVRRDLDQIAADNGFDFHIITMKSIGMRVGLTVLLCARLKADRKTDCGTASDVP